MMEQKLILVVFSTLLFVMVHGDLAIPNASDRANLTIQGLYRYFWSQDPLNKDAMFFFACGQIGGGGGRTWKHCGCATPAVCLECYRWWDAVALETVATYGIYTGTKDYSDTPDHIFNHSPYNAKWDANPLTGCTFMDDFSWFGIAYLRVYEWLKDPKWLQQSVELYDWIWRYGWDKACGGFWWTDCPSQLYKDSITIVEMLHFSSKLSYMFPEQSRYLVDAQKIWNWFFSFDNGYGLMSDKNLISTGAIPERCCNATHNDSYTRCHNSKISGTSYNQGLLMSSSAYLYRRTGDNKYLNTGLRALNGILSNYTTDEGVLIDEPRSYPTYQYSCSGLPSDPGGDFYSFQGIFMLHLGYFVDLLSEVNVLSYYTLQDIITLVERTSNGAWNRSANWPPFNVTVDVCDINGPSKNVGLPKFHWWWNNHAIIYRQVIPPDPRHFFHKLQLQCTPLLQNNTQIWAGLSTTELNCTILCQNNSNCSKYLFDMYPTTPTIDCWLWSFNRSDHICATSNYNFNIGIKRPIGNATCASKCYSSEPQPLDEGVCYCDVECTKHLDCCLDYADHCTPPEPITCEGLCNVMEPHAIPGGGYCWCSAGCNGGFTDNNSDGSCCPDYHEQCLNQTMPMCLDARTQASALGLFVTHLKVASIKDK